MELIIGDEFFDEEQIDVKRGRNGLKILYKMDNIYLTGIPLKIVGFKVVKQTSNHLIINIAESNQYHMLKKIETHFANKYQLPYDGLINNENLIIKKNNKFSYTKLSELYISINNIKMKNSFVTFQLFTI